MSATVRSAPRNHGPARRDLEDVEVLLEGGAGLRVGLFAVEGRPEDRAEEARLQRRQDQRRGSLTIKFSIQTTYTGTG